jgi:hypothetical protein
MHSFFFPLVYFKYYLKLGLATLEKNVTENSIENLETKKHELEALRNEKMKGKLVRSRAQWVDEGEKPTKIFVS